MQSWFRLAFCATCDKISVWSTQHTVRFIRVAPTSSKNSFIFTGEILVSSVFFPWKYHDWIMRWSCCKGRTEQFYWSIDWAQHTEYLALNDHKWSVINLCNRRWLLTWDDQKQQHNHHRACWWSAESDQQAANQGCSSVLDIAPPHAWIYGRCKNPVACGRLKSVCSQRVTDELNLARDKEHFLLPGLSQ